MKKKLLQVVALLSAISLLLSGCAQPNTMPSANTGAPISGAAVSASALLSEEDFLTDYDDSATMIALKGTTAEIMGSGASYSTGLVTITSAGTYVLSGSFDGQLLIDADKHALVHIILNGVSIQCDNNAAIYGSKSKKIILTLADNTENTLSDGTDYFYENAEADEPNAAFFSKDDITLNGNGTLFINGNHADGIRSKDTIIILSGNYEITTVKDGIQGKDALYIADGSFVINAGKDALKSSNDKDAEKGFVTVDGGVFEITCGDDAFHAETALTVNNGKIMIYACYEGLEGLTVEINGGEISITSEDDGINAAGGNSDTAEGPLSKDITTQNIALSADFDPFKDMEPPGGMEAPDGMEPHEGVEPPGDMEIPGGFDGQGRFDGEKPADSGRQDFGGNPGGGFGGDFGENPGGGFGGGFGGNPGGGFGGGFGGDSDGNENACITINGGTIYVNAGGDGIDSNGYFYMNGGTAYVEGPENNANGALDYAYDAEISGGTFLAIGASGMAMSFGENSSQQSIFLRLREWQNAGTEITLMDDGEVIFTFTSQKSFNSIVLSLPELSSGITYALTCGSVTEEVTVSGNRMAR